MKRIDRILTDCLDDIASGRATIEDCLGRYPELRAELEPLLRLAAGIDSLPPVAPSAGFRARARAGVMEYAHDHPLKRPQGGWMAGILTGPAWARVIAIVLAVLVVVAGAGTGTAYASQSSLPGDLLYPVKTGTENWREWLETDAARDSLLQVEFAGRRIDELERLIAASSPDIHIAVSGYGNNLDKAIIYSDNVISGTLPEDIASAIAGQLERLDSIDEVSSAPAVAETGRLAVEGHVRVLRRIAESGPVKAGEMTATAMRARLENAAGAASSGNTVRAENALRLFNRYAALVEEILDASEGTAAGAAVASLFRQHAEEQQALFDSFSARVSPQVAGEVRTAIQNMNRYRGDTGGDQGAGPNSQDGQPGDYGQGSGSQNEEPGNQSQEPGSQDGGTGNQAGGPGGQNEDPGAQGQAPGDQDAGPVGPGQPVDPGQGGSGGSGNSPDAPPNG